VVLVLEDLHWSDPSTVEVLALLARRRDPARLLVLGTYRPVELILHDHPRKLVKQELAAHGQCVGLPLGGLSPQALFDQVVTQAREYGLIRNRLRLQDATHVIANIAAFRLPCAWSPRLGSAGWRRP